MKDSTENTNASSSKKVIHSFNKDGVEVFNLRPAPTKKPNDSQEKSAVTPKKK